MDKPLRIGQLARRTGVDARTIRFYEEIGLLPAPARTNAGYRLYSAEDVARLEFICRVKTLGFSLGEIKEILSCRSRGQAPCPYVTRLIHEKAADVDRRIAELRQVRKELIELEQVAAVMQVPEEDGAGSICHILEGNTEGARERDCPARLDT